MFIVPVPSPTKKLTTSVAANGAFTCKHHPNAVEATIYRLVVDLSVGAVSGRFD